MIKIIQAKTRIEFIQVRNIRIKIFVIEQQIPWRWEFDIHDKNAVHLIVVNSKEIIGTGRFYHDKYSGDYKLGRMAIVETYRNQGIGSKMLIKIEEIARNKKVPKIILEAQSDKLHFYVNHGYKIEGDKYLMDGIYHTKMFKKL
jgi:predicted GNAT family N-acyltransferase